MATEAWEQAFERHFVGSDFATGALKNAMRDVFLAGWRAAESSGLRPAKADKPKNFAASWDGSR